LRICRLKIGTNLIFSILIAEGGSAGETKGLSADLIRRLGVAREWGESQEREAKER